MYNPQLKTFLQVADAGSFSKAAEQLYITAPAVIKQVNLLEKNLGVELFIRSHRGLELTAAGRSLYQEAQNIIRHCEEASNRVRQAAKQNTNTVRVGFSPLAPPDRLIPLLPRIYQLYPNLEIHMLPYINSEANASGILRNLGQDFDVVPGFFDKTTLDLRRCAGIELCRIPLCCAVPRNHPLSQKEHLTWEDLSGQQLLIIRQGWSQATDELRQELRHHPEIETVSFQTFTLDEINRCVNENRLMVAFPNWENLHPEFKMLTMDWDYTIPYGLFHAPEPSPAVRQFLDAIRTLHT